MTHTPDGIDKKLFDLAFQEMFRSLRDLPTGVEGIDMAIDCRPNRWKITAWLLPIVWRFAGTDAGIDIAAVHQ